MEYKNISTLSSRILTEMNTLGKAWFTVSELYALLPDLSEGSLCVHVKRMADKGLLMRIQEGLYYIIPFEQDSETFMPDWHLLAEPLAGKEHYIGYYSALQIHGLITQPSLKEQIVVKKQKKPSETTVHGVNFQFIYHNEKHYFGYQNEWIDSFNKVRCSDIEKTLIDCLYKPEYAGGIVEVAKALFEARKRIKFETLLDYGVRFDSQAILKRLGYLLELMEIDSPIIEELRRLRSSSVSLLDTEAPKIGKVLTRWNIMQNVDADTIRGSVAT